MASRGQNRLFLRSVVDASGECINEERLIWCVLVFGKINLYFSCDRISQETGWHVCVCDWKHCLAWDLGPQVVGADSQVGWVDQFLSVDVVGEAVPVSVGGGEVEEGVGLGLGLSLGVSWPLAQLVLNQIHGVLYSLGVNGAQSAVNGLLKEINKCLTFKNSIS